MDHPCQPLLSPSSSLCRPCCSTGRRRAHDAGPPFSCVSLEDKEDAHDAPCPSSLFSPCPPLLSLSESLDRAVARRSPPSTLPSIPADPEQADAAFVSASPSCTSPPQESARGRRNRPRRAVPFRHMPPPPSTLTSPSGLPRPRRQRHRTQGERANPLDISLALISP